MGKFTYQTLKKEPTRATYCCAGKECGWRSVVTKQKDGMLQLQFTERLHTCEGGGVAKHPSASQKDWLDQAVSGHLRVVKDTKIPDIQDCIQVNFVI